MTSTKKLQDEDLRDRDDENTFNGGYIVQVPDTLNYRRVPEVEVEAPGK